MEMDVVSIIICAALCAYALYLAINIARSTKVTAYLAGYEEESRFDPDLGYSVDEKIPVYSYEYKGFRRRHKSIFALPLWFMKKDTHSLYVREDGKAFEAEGVVFCVIAALLIFFLR